MPGHARHIRRALVAATLLGSLSCDHPTAPDPITAVEVSPFVPILLVGPGGGQTVQLLAQVVTASGALRNAAGASWTSSAPTFASVSDSGLVTARAPGTAFVSATVGSLSGTAIITVRAVPVTSLTLSADSVTLDLSPLAAGQHQLAVELRDSTGTILPARPITWSTTASNVARVSFAGLVTAVSNGTATIVASAEGRADSVAILVAGVDSLPDDADIVVEDAQWTQGLQLDDGSLPIIRGGRAAVLNVVLAATVSIARPSRLMLRLRAPGGALAWSDSVDVSVQTGTPRTFASPTAQFLVPNGELLPGRTWEVVRDPNGVLADSSAANDRLPREGPAPLSLSDVPLLRVRFVPVVLLSHGGAAGNVSPALIDAYLETVRAIYPHGAIEASVGAPFSTSQSFGTAPSGGTADFWIPLIGQLDIARVADPAFADAHWIGVVAPPPGFDFSAYGGFAYIPSDGASFGAFTRTSALVNLGWFTREHATRELVAHELGHNFGRFHAPSCEAGNPDPNYPRSDGTVGPGGHDVAGWAAGRLPRAAAINPGAGDVMGYCSFVWAGRYTYQGILDFRSSGAVVALRAPAARTRVILVRGTIDGGRIAIDPAVAIEGLPGADNARGEYLVEGLAADGRPLFAQRVALGTIDHAEQVRPFAASVALDEAVEAELVTIRVRGPAGEARRTRTVAPALSLPGAGGTVQRSPAGIRISCADVAAQALVVQDDVTGEVIGMAHAATIQLRAVASARLRLSCSDGVRTTTVVTGGR